MSVETLPAKSGQPASELAERYQGGEAEAREEIRAFIDKAQAGDRQAAAHVAEMIQAIPRLADMIAPDIAKVVEERLIRRSYGKDCARLHGSRPLSPRLAPPGAGRPEPLGRRAPPGRAGGPVLAGLLLRRLPGDRGQGPELSARPTTPPASADRAHRRYLSSLKALASVRKLPIVALQVNLGDGPPSGGKAEARQIE